MKFYTITYFIKYIQDYGNAINYNTVHSEVAHKYSFNTFYRQTNKKEYKFQILIYIISYINIIDMHNVILIVKILDKSDKNKQLVIDTFDVEVT